MTGEKDATAEMPGVEEIARAIYERRNGHGCKPWSLLTKAHKEPYLGDAEAAHALFAPILAESRNATRYADELLKTRADAAEANALKAMWNDRALAAEAALAKAVVFEFGEHHYVESRGDGTWAVKNGGCVLNVDGVWEYEPNPSNRTDEFIARTRFDRDDAFRRAAAIRAEGV